MPSFFIKEKYMSNINKFTITKNPPLSEKFNEIYKLSLPKYILEKMLSNSFMVSYIMILSEDHRKEFSNMLSSEDKKIVKPLDYLKELIHTPELEIIDRINDLDEEFTWYTQTYNEVIITDGIAAIESKTMFYFNTEETSKTVIKDIILPIKLEY